MNLLNSLFFKKEEITASDKVACIVFVSSVVTMVLVKLS